jgi:hypothetical protein
MEVLTGPSNIPLRKPRRGHYRELLPQLSNSLRTIRYHHNGLLHGRARHIRMAINQELGIELARASNAEEGRRRYFRFFFPAQCEV